MKAKFKRLISSLLLVSLLISTFSVFSISEVSATAENTNEIAEQLKDAANKTAETVKNAANAVSGTKGTADLVEGLKKVSVLAGDGNIEDIASTVSLVIGSLTTSGFTPESIAGILCNMFAESHFDPFAFEGHSSNRFEYYNQYKSSGAKTFTYSDVSGLGKEVYGGFGLCQWTFERHVAVSNYCKNSGEYVTINGKFCDQYSNKSSIQSVSYLSDVGTQIAYLNQDQSWVPNESKAGLPSIGGVSDFKRLTDATNASKYWTLCYEVCTDLENAVNVRCQNANDWLQIVNGNYDWSAYADKSQAAAIGKQLAGAGYWNEDQLGAFCRVMEMNVDEILEGAMRENLGYNEMEGLATWERNIKYDNEDNGVIGLLRRIVMLLGIAIIVWMSLIYLAYWFDRINVIYLDVLGVVTLGHLHMSETEEECTFRIKDLGKEGRKTVNHRAIAGICLVGIAFGVLIVSGWYYVALQKIVHLIQRLLRKVG